MCLITFWGCHPNQQKEELSKAETAADIRFAERFKIEEEGEVRIITIDKPWQGSKAPIKYLLYQDDVPERFADDETFVKIKTPVKTIVSNLTTQLSLMEELGVEDKLIGFGQTKLIYSPVFKEKVQNGTIREVGPDGSLDIESILDLNPDVVLAFSSGSESRQLEKLKELGVNVVLNAGYMETSVLGRYEWIKLLAHLTGTEQKAAEIFDQKAVIYDSLLQLVKGKTMPSVMTGTLYGGTWFLPAGKNYGANIISDAGGKYLWLEDETTGWLSLDFESVFEKGYDADYWIGVASFTTLDQLKQADERYQDFKAYREENVYSYMARVNEEGAVDYFESGNVNPDKLLADHIKILHPDLLPDYELYYYMKLQ